MSYRAVFVAYGTVGGALALLYLGLSSAVEATAPVPAASLHDSDGNASTAHLAPALAGSSADVAPAECAATPAQAAVPAAPCCPRWLAAVLPDVSLGLRRRESVHIVAKLSVLFFLDSFADAFILQSWIAYWFASRWSFDATALGGLLAGANVVAGATSLATGLVVARLGAMLTMLVTHLPSNALLLAVPLMPSAPAAAAVLVSRFALSQMDEPACTAYLAAAVASDERAAAAGIANVCRSAGLAAGPLLLGYLASASSAAPGNSALLAAPWLLAGSAKAVYDVALFALYRCDATLSGGVRSARKERKHAEALAKASSASS